MLPASSWTCNALTWTPLALHPGRSPAPEISANRNTAGPGAQAPWWTQSGRGHPQRAPRKLTARDFNDQCPHRLQRLSHGLAPGGTDAAAGISSPLILAPLVQARLPIVTDRVTCISTPGSSIDVLVTRPGIAVNPLRPELAR
ncbi:MAG: citrate lyase subunit alpha [Oscillospiraceae bacterium]